FRDAHRGLANFCRYALRSSKRETLRSRTVLSKTTRHSLSTRPAPVAESFLRGRANSEKGLPIGRGERSLFTDYKSGKQSLSFRDAHRGLAKTTRHSGKSKMTRWRNLLRNRLRGGAPEKARGAIPHDHARLLPLYRHQPQSWAYVE